MTPNINAAAKALEGPADHVKAQIAYIQREHRRLDAAPFLNQPLHVDGGENVELDAVMEGLAAERMLEENNAIRAAQHQRTVDLTTANSAELLALRKRESDLEVAFLENSHLIRILHQEVVASRHEVQRLRERVEKRDKVMASHGVRIGKLTSTTDRLWNVVQIVGKAVRKVTTLDIPSEWYDGDAA